MYLRANAGIARAGRLVVNNAAGIAIPMIAIPKSARRVAPLRIDKLLNVGSHVFLEGIQTGSRECSSEVVNLVPVLVFNCWLERKSWRESAGLDARPTARAHQTKVSRAAPGVVTQMSAKGNSSMCP